MYEIPFCSLNVQSSLTSNGKARFSYALEMCQEKGQSRIHSFSFRIHSACHVLVVLIYLNSMSFFVRPLSWVLLYCSEGDRPLRTCHFHLVEVFDLKKKWKHLKKSWKIYPHSPKQTNKLRCITHTHTHTHTHIHARTTHARTHRHTPLNPAYNFVRGFEGAYYRGGGFYPGGLYPR